MTDPSNNAEIHAFLETFWSLQESQGTVFLSVKEGSWTDYPVTLPVDITDLGPLTDLYFTPCVFDGDRRLRTNATGKYHWLYADLDEVDPASIEPRPQVAWETSPGRYQAAWRMDTPLGPRAFERLNKALTYYTGADKGGWSCTKVLRVPGSVSMKYGTPWTVRLLWADWVGTVDTDAVRGLAKPVLPASDPASGPIRLPRSSAREIRREHWDAFSPRTRKLVRAKVVHRGDDRSAKLWDLAKGLLEAGLTPGQAVKVMQDTPWNKYKGQNRELRRLWEDVTKAESSMPERPQGNEPRSVTRQHNRYTPIRMAKYLALSAKKPSWLVDQVWSEGAHGLWAGDYKTYKSTMLIDLGLSVASGTPFLNCFNVPRPGPVLMIQEENSPSFMNDKLMRIASNKNIGTRITWGDGKIENVSLGMDTNFSMLNQKRFNLGDDEDQRWLDAYLEANPHRLIILDPMYRLTPGIDENSAVELSPVLSWLATLSTERECAIILAHHYNKSKDHTTRKGNRVSGSGILNRWWSSAVYAERFGEPEENTIRFSFEHREHPNLGVKHAVVHMKEDDQNHYHVSVTDADDHQDRTIIMPGEDTVPDEPEPLVFEIPDRDRSGWGLADKGMKDFDYMIQGEVIPLKQAAKTLDITISAMRSKVEKSTSWKIAKPAIGPKVIVKVK